MPSVRTAGQAYDAKEEQELQRIATIFQFLTVLRKACRAAATRTSTGGSNPREENPWPRVLSPRGTENRRPGSPGRATTPTWSY